MLSIQRSRALFRGSRVDDRLLLKVSVDANGVTVMPTAIPGGLGEILGK